MTSDFEDVQDGRSTYVTAFGRGLSVIRCFSAERPTLTIAEVARETGLNRATARRFLHTLETDGYVTSDYGRYTLRPAIMALGNAYLSAMAINTGFQRRLQALSEQVHESCSVGALDGFDTVFVARAKPTAPRMMTLALNVGDRLPAFLTALGRVLLAELPNRDLDDYISTAPFEAKTERTVTDPNRLKDTILQVREQGYSVSDQEIEHGVLAVATAVLRPTGPPLAISIATHTAKTKIEVVYDEFLPALREKAAELSSTD